MAIHLLDPKTAELIAAGEVVERPASVVKELVENAIDAGASTVAVEIERGGIALIRVADNGGGIAAEDIPLAFVRHATSKVRTEADLEAIASLGFRGEALASIAAVARVELLTKHPADEFASLFRMEGGRPGKREAAARPQGTSITVRELFYNTPARMKFLKKDASEGGFVTETVTRLALSHPEVAFQYTRDGKQVFVTPGGELKSAVWAVLGSAFARELTEVAGEGANMAVHGLVTPPRAGRASRSMQYFYINGRFVKSRTMMAALEQAYRGLAMQGKFPGGILFLEMPHALVDVNVHPAKTEVRFARESDVFDVVYRTVKAALLKGSAGYSRLVIPQRAETRAAEVGERGAQAAPDARADARGAAAPVGPKAPAAGAGQIRAYNEMVRRTAGLAGTMESPAGVVVYETRADKAWAPDVAEPESVNEPEPTQTSFEDAGEKGERLRLVGEVFRTYIVAEAGQALYLIDKHAAHERMLYEKLAALDMDGGAQQLLAPVNVVLGAEEKSALLQNAVQLAGLGMEVEDFGGNSVLVRSVPADIEPDDVEDLAVELGQRLAVNARDSGDAKREWVLHSMACRAAVKGGDRTPAAQLLGLAQTILDGEIPPFCPHGRPVVLEITRRELEKQFGRLG